MVIRIGQGFDVHQYQEDRKLMIGGVQIPYEKGLLGHSDADVLLHALSDAILGALGKGDIGKWYPDTDESIEGIDSKKILSGIWDMVIEEGFQLENADMTIIAQQPKMAPHIQMMKSVIASTLGCNENQLNIKATTTEKLGFLGRGEGIAAEAVVLLTK